MMDINNFGPRFGDRLSEIMGRVDISIDKLARDIGENVQTIRYWIKGGEIVKNREKLGRLPSIFQFSKLLEVLQNGYPDANIDANFFFKSKTIKEMVDGEAISMNQLLEILKIELGKFSTYGRYDGIFSTSEKFFFEKKDLLDLYYKAAKNGKNGAIRRIFVLDGNSVSDDLNQLMNEHYKNKIETKYVFKKTLPLPLQILDLCLFYKDSEVDSPDSVTQCVFIDIPIKHQFFSHAVFSKTNISVENMKTTFNDLWVKSIQWEPTREKV